MLGKWSSHCAVCTPGSKENLPKGNAKHRVSGLGTDLPEEVQVEEIFLSYLHSKKDRQLSKMPKNKYPKAANHRTMSNLTVPQEHKGITNITPFH